MKTFKELLKSTFVVASLFGLGACSDTEFTKTSTSLQKYTVNVGQVDILFVVDNSGSMSEEQRRMANAFPNFYHELELAGLDYRIGIITTDVLPENHPNYDGEALRNGNLLQFPNGDFYLTPDTRNIVNEFTETIQRDETIYCEQSGYRNCPSDDERGIYAAYLAVNANKENFFRENGHLAIVFLTDEDVRGFGTSSDQYIYRMPEPLDYPENLLQVIETRLGRNTDVSAHAIITDSQYCVDQQRAQGGNQYIHGAIGTFYASMTSPQGPSIINPNQGVTMASFAGGQLVPGTVGSICAANYDSELGSIRSVLTKTKSSERLRCALLAVDEIDVRIDSNYTWELTESRDEIIFTPALPPGESFKLEYECI